MIPRSRSFLPVVLALAASASAQGEVDSRSAVKKSGDVWLVHDSTMSARGELQGQELRTSERVTYTLHLRVTDVDAEGNYLVETTIARVQGRIELAMGQGEFDFDSAAAGDEPAAAPQGSPRERKTKQQLFAAAGKSFACKVAPTGRALALTSDVKSMLAERTDVIHQLDEAALQQFVEAAFGVMPEKRTAGGAKWQQERTLWYGRLATRQKVDLTLTLVDLEFFEIETAGTLDIDREAAKKARGFVAEAGRQLDNTQVKNSKLTSRQRTSRKDGFVIEATSEAAMDWEMSDPRQGDVTMAWKIATATRRTTAEAALARSEKKDAKPEREKGERKDGDGK